MKTLISALLIALSTLIVGCAGIPKPDWNPGSTQPAAQTSATCPLSGQWTWNAEHKQWICVPVRATYYGYGPYYAPGYPVYGPGYPVYGPVIYGPVFVPPCGSWRHRCR